MRFLRKIFFGEVQSGSPSVSEERASRDVETKEFLEKRFSEEVAVRKKAELLVLQYEKTITEDRHTLTELRSELAKALAREDSAKIKIRNLRTLEAEVTAVNERLQTLEHDLVQSNRRYERVEEKLQQEKAFRVAAEQQVEDLKRLTSEGEQVSRDLRLALAKEKRAKKLSEERRLEIQELYESNTKLRKDIARLRQDYKKRDLQLQQALAELEIKRGHSGSANPDAIGAPFDSASTQVKISIHVPEDDAADWGDVPIDLPTAVINPSSNSRGRRGSSPESLVSPYANKGLGRNEREKVDHQTDNPDCDLVVDPVDWLDVVDDGGMGSIELLTREGEIEIAKRIEDGLKHS